MREIQLYPLRHETRAAFAYDVAAREAFGEFARTNFPAPVAT